MDSAVEPGGPMTGPRTRGAACIWYQHPGLRVDLELGSRPKPLSAFQCVLHLSIRPWVTPPFNTQQHRATPVNHICTQPHTSTQIHTDLHTVTHSHTQPHRAAHVPQPYAATSSHTQSHTAAQSQTAPQVPIQPHRATQSRTRPDTATERRTEPHTVTQICTAIHSYKEPHRAHSHKSHREPHAVT